MNQPQTKTSDITDEIRRYAESGETPSQFDIARMKREAKAVKGVNAAYGYMLEGMLACILGNIEDAISSHENSISISTHPILYGNYVSSLAKLQQYSKAYEIAKQALSAFQGSQLALENACAMAFKSGYFEESLKHFTDLEKLLPDGVKSEKALTAYNQSKRILEEDLPPEKVKDAFARADAMLIKHNVQSKTFILEEYHGEWSMFVKADTTPEQSADMNNELCEELAKVPGHSRDSVTVIFTPSS